MEEFTNTRAARRRISLAEDLLAASIKEESKQSLSQVLSGITEAVRDSNQLDAAERLYGAFVRDELAKILGHDISSVTPSQPELIKEVRGLPAIAEKIPVHFQSRFLDLVKETHPLEWREIVFALLKTSQGKFTTECINFLMENGQGDELAAALKRWKTEQNLRAPVLLWIIKNRHSKKFSKLLNELITPRLLGAIFFAIDYEALQSAGTRRIPLAEALSDDTDLISDLLASALLQKKNPPPPKKFPQPPKRPPPPAPPRPLLLPHRLRAPPAPRPPPHPARRGPERRHRPHLRPPRLRRHRDRPRPRQQPPEIGRASCRERV